jgi:hypothetical protein
VEKCKANSLAAFSASYDGSLKSVGQRIFLKGNIYIFPFLKELAVDSIEIAFESKKYKTRKRQGQGERQD